MNETHSAQQVTWLSHPIAIEQCISNQRMPCLFPISSPTVATLEKHFFLSISANHKYNIRGTSLVAQWLRICLPMQGTRVQALVREDPTCCRETKPMHHNYWACALEPTSHNYWTRVPQLLKPVLLEPMLCNKRSHRSEKPSHRNEE